MTRHPWSRQGLELCSTPQQLGGAGDSTPDHLINNPETYSTKLPLSRGGEYYICYPGLTLIQTVYIIDI